MQLFSLGKTAASEDPRPFTDRCYGHHEQRGAYSRLRAEVICLLAITLGGCASTTTFPLTQAAVPFRVVVIQAPMAVDAGRLQTVLEPNTKKTLSVSAEPLLRGVSHAQEHASAAMASALAHTPNLVVIAPPATEQERIAHIQASGTESAATQEDADHLRAATGADALLKFRITDYGLTPRSWRNGYVALEVTTTLALAAVIAYSGSKTAKAAAGIYLAQEAIEETASAYAGFWALEETSRPVRIEAELIGLNPVSSLSKTSDTGFSKVVLSRLFRQVSADERNMQLDQATDNAARGIASDILRTLEASEAETK